MRIGPNPILDYRPPHPDDRRAPRWLLKLLILAAILAFPVFYALFAVFLIATPLLVVGAPLSLGLLGIAACAITGTATFGSLWLIDYGMDRTSE